MFKNKVLEERERERINSILQRHVAFKRSFFIDKNVTVVARRRVIQPQLRSFRSRTCDSLMSDVG